MRRSGTLTGVLLALGLVVGACGNGDAVDPDAVEDTVGADEDSSNEAEPGVSGDGTITWNDQTHDFTFVSCGEAGGGFVINAVAGPLSLGIAGEDPDDPQISVGEELDQFTARPGRGDGDFSFDGSQANGSMRFTAPDGDVRQGSFDLTCD